MTEVKDPTGSQDGESVPEEYDEYEYEFEELTDEEEEDEAADLRRKKLAQKPPKNKRLCGKASARYDLSDVPSTAKLSLRRKSGLDLMMQRIPQPKGAVPRTALPTWYEFSMNEKIPLIPAPPNYIYYSRGTIGQPLLRPNPFYSVNDQRNLERVVGAPYDALHDPHAKKYLSKPSITSFMKKQGLINDNNEVLCSLREFNKFRDYLRTQYNDEVQRAVSSGDTMTKSDREQLQMIRRWESDFEGRQSVLNARRGKAKEIQAETARARTAKIESKQKQAEQRLAEWNEAKNKEKLNRVLKGFEKEKKQAERYLMVMQKRVEAQRETLKQTTLKDIEVAERRKNDQQMMTRALEKFQIEWIDSKLEYCKQRIERDDKLEESMREEIKTNAKKRQRKVEHYRSQMPALLEKKKEGEKRLWEIVRKFAMRWLEKVRKRLNAPKDVQHESVWIGKSKGVLDDTLKFLKELSGYEKMDDFVLNIIKLKRQIQQQIEIEEAQEAAEAAKAAAEAGESEVPHSKPRGSKAEAEIPVKSTVPPKTPPKEPEVQETEDEEVNGEDDAEEKEAEEVDEEKAEEADDEDGDDE